MSVMQDITRTCLLFSNMLEGSEFRKGKRRHLDYSDVIANSQMENDLIISGITICSDTQLNEKGLVCHLECFQTQLHSDEDRHSML